MKWIEVVTPLVGHLAWPIALVVLAVIFRKSLRGLLGRLTSAEGPGVKMAFSEAIAEVERLTDRVVKAVEPPTADGQGETRSGPQQEQAEREFNDRVFFGSEPIDAAGVMLSAWREVEIALGRLWNTRVSAYGTEAPRLYAPLRIANHLRWNGTITVDIYDAIRTMRIARNQIAHGGGEPTAGQARTYAQSAREVAAVLNQIAGEYLGKPLTPAERAFEYLRQPQPPTDAEE